MVGLMLIYVDVLFMCGECMCNFFGSWSFSKNECGIYYVSNSE